MSARSAFPFAQRWIAQYNNDPNSIGRVEIGYYLDEPRVPGDVIIVGYIQNASGSRHVPVGPQAAAIVYNIPSFPDVPSGLRLNASLLYQIFNGSITRWDDPAIVDVNGGLNLPSERIVLVREASNSSTLALVERYLSASVTWPESSIRVMGPDELATTVRTTPYSIGYVDFSYATQTRMTFAALDSGGEYVLPSMDSIEMAINTGLQNTTANVIINASRFGNSSYPLTELYYASLEQENNATLDFIDWMTSDEGQQVLAEVQYPAVHSEGQLAAYEERRSNSTG